MGTPTLPATMRVLMRHVPSSLLSLPVHSRRHIHSAMDRPVPLFSTPSCRSFHATSRCVMLPCAHIYHSDCLLRWFETGKANDGACPICRQSFLPARTAAPAQAPRVAGETVPAAVGLNETEEMTPAPHLATGTSSTDNVGALPAQLMPHWVGREGGQGGSLVAVQRQYATSC
jgi:hypothetical protein